MLKNINQKNVIKYFVILGITLLFCQNFLQMHYSSDTYVLYDLGYMAYPEKYFLLDGRLISTVVCYLAGFLKIPIPAFRNCTGLRNIYIGSHITSIGSYAFEGGSDDLKIYTNASSTLEGWESYWNYQKERWDSNGVPWHVAYKVNYNTTLEEFNALVANESE